MAASLFSEDLWSRIVNVAWGGAFMLVEMVGPEQMVGLRLRVVDPSGAPEGSPWRHNDPPDAPDPGIDVGVILDRTALAPYRVLFATERADAVTIPGSGAILGWVQAFPYYPDNDTGSAVGVWDKCLDPDTQAYVGDTECQAREAGGVVPAGGVARHLSLATILSEYTSDTYKRVYYSHQGNPDQRVFFIDDRLDWSPDSGLTEAAWNAALLEPYDRALFKAERAIVDGETTDTRWTIAWLVNFSYRATGPVPPGLLKPVTIAIELEEPEAGGSIPDASIRLRRWSTPHFTITAAPDGLNTVYSGSRSPAVDVTRTSLTYGPSGEVARFNRSGFIEA